VEVAPAHFHRGARGDQTSGELFIVSTKLAQALRPGWFLEHYLQFIPLDQSPFLIGRGINTGLSLALSVISRHHAELSWNSAEGCWMVRDMGSTNGTFVNDKPVTGLHKVMNGDFLRLASVEVRLAHMPLSQSQTGANDNKRTDVLGRLPDRTLSVKEKIERTIGHIIRQGNCTAQDLADTLNVERSTMYRHVMQEFQMSPSDLLRERRLEYAADLLKADKLTVQQVADKTGFESPAHFSRAFKKRFGVVPSQFLDQNPQQ